MNLQTTHSLTATGPTKTLPPSFFPFECNGSPDAASGFPPRLFLLWGGDLCPAALCRARGIIFFAIGANGALYQFRMSFSASNVEAKERTSSRMRSESVVPNIVPRSAVRLEC